MLRRIKRLRDFDIALNIRSNHFIRPPRDAQRDWLLNRAVDEFARDLVDLNKLAPRFVAGAPDDRPPRHWSEAELSDDDIMEAWQAPIMAAMAAIVTADQGDVLEIGFGRGVSADLIQQGGARSHTIVECSEAILPRYEAWRAGYPARDIRLVHSRWEEAGDALSDYDAIFFHTYAMDEAEYVEFATKNVTFAAPFFPTAARLLRPGGVFTYLTNEIDSLSRPHQRLLFEHFRSFEARVVPLDVPADTRDAWWADSMIVVRAVR